MLLCSGPGSAIATLRSACALLGVEGDGTGCGGLASEPLHYWHVGGALGGSGQSWSSRVLLGAPTPGSLQINMIAASDSGGYVYQLGLAWGGSGTPEVWAECFLPPEGALQQQIVPWSAEEATLSLSYDPLVGVSYFADGLLVFTCAGNGFVQTGPRGFHYFYELISTDPAAELALSKGAHATDFRDYTIGGAPPTSYSRYCGYNADNRPFVGWASTGSSDRRLLISGVLSEDVDYC